jgi:hypothetical protein
VGHTSPLTGEVLSYGWRSRAIGDTTDRRALAVGRGHPVGPALAASYDGGGIAADPSTTRPVQVLFALRPASGTTMMSKLIPVSLIADALRLANR